MSEDMKKMSLDELIGSKEGGGAEASRSLDLLNLMIYWSRWSRWSRCCFQMNVWTAVLHSSSDYLFLGGGGLFPPYSCGGGGLPGPTFSQKYEMGGSPKLQSKLWWMLDVGVALKRNHRSNLNGSAAPFDSTSSSSVLMRRYQMWGGSFPKTDRTIFSLGRTCPCWKSLKQCYYTFHNPHPCTKQKFAQRLGAVPSGYPNPTRYPVFLSIPDPTRFSFRYHRVAGNPKHRVLPDVSGFPLPDDI